MTSSPCRRDSVCAILDDTRTAALLQPRTTWQGMVAPTRNDFATVSQQQQPPAAKAGATQINSGGVLQEEHKPVHLRGRRRRQGDASSCGPAGGSS